MGKYIGYERESASRERDNQYYVAAAGQSSFGAKYSPGYVDVYVNGVKLHPSEFTAINGSTVVLATPCVVGDEVSISGQITSAPYDYYTKSQVNSRVVSFSIATGTADSMIITPNPVPAALVDGMQFNIRIPGTNSSATPIVTIVPLGVAKTLSKFGGGPLNPGDLFVNQEIIARYNSVTDKLELVSLSSSAGSVGDIKWVSSPNASVGTLKANGAAVSRTAYARLFKFLVTDFSGFVPRVFTVSIASPAVFTLNTHNFKGGERLRLYTTGTLPTGLNTTSDFFVEVIDTNTFYLVTTGGTRIITTGTQSGTHSALQSWFGLGDGSTTFNVPDLRGEFIRGWDDGRNRDTGRVFGTWQKGTVVAIDTPVAAVWGISANVDGQPSQILVGADDYQEDNYSGVTMNGVSTNGSVNLKGNGEGWSGISRPNNVALLPCIVY